MQRDLYSLVRRRWDPERAWRSALQLKALRRVAYGVQEGAAAGEEIAIRGARPGRVDHDHQPVGGEEGDGLAEDAERRKAAARSDPPEVAVTDALRQGAAGDALAGRLGHPAVGHDRPGASRAARLAAFEDELAKPRIVADRHGDAAAAELVARRVEHPDRVALHAEGLPELLRGVVAERLAGRLRHHHADEMGLAGVVVEGRARLVRARQ